LMRLIVHACHDGKASGSHLRDVAEAFRDCQAVQARVIERVGLELSGQRDDFAGIVKRLVSNYKGLAIKMLALERIRQRKAVDDGNPTHYENRLTADIGDLIGANKDDIRRAALDRHAEHRYPRLTPKEQKEAASRCRELFDIEAMLMAFCSEASSFDADSSAESLPRLFLDWASVNITEPHVVFKDDSCTRVEVPRSLVLALFEALFLQKVQAAPDEKYRDFSVLDLFARRG